MPSFGTDAISALQAAMRFRMARESVIASNIANADTPGYRRRELSFDKVLETETGRMARTHEKHMPVRSGDSAEGRVTKGPRGSRPDGNAIDLDQELVTAHRNAGAFIDQANVLARVSQLVRTAIGQG